MADPERKSKDRPNWGYIAVEQIVKSFLATLTVVISVWVIAIIGRATNVIHCETISWFDLPGC